MYVQGLAVNRFGNSPNRLPRFSLLAVFAEVIRAEEDTCQVLRHFYQMVNHFNLDYYQFLQLGASWPLLSTEVYAYPLTAIGVSSNPDAVITNGQPAMVKVGVGEVKPPWVVQRNSISVFLGNLPYLNFGEEFIAPRSL